LIFEGLQAAEFEYFGAEELSQDPEWTSDWEDKPRYPNMLKLTLADKERAWPEMLVDLPQVTDYAK